MAGSCNSTLAIDFEHSRKLQDVVSRYNLENPTSKLNGKNLIARVIDFMYDNGVDFLKKETPKDEVWKDILGYRGQYQISNLGRVKRLEQTIGFETARRGRATRRINEMTLTTKRNVFGEDYVTFSDGESYTIATLLKNHF